MDKKTKGAGKPAPKGDTTATRRQAKRRAQLDAIARAQGWGSASEALTAWKNGNAVMVKINGAGA